MFTILSFSTGQALETIYYFLMQNQIWIRPKIVSVHPTDSDVGKLLDFDNIQIRTPSHPLAIAHFRRLPHEHGTLYHNRFRMRLLFLSSDGTWRLCCSSRPFRLTNNMSRAVYQRQTVTCLATLTESDCTVVLQQKCDNATLIIFISTTTTTTTSVLLR